MIERGLQRYIGRLDGGDDRPFHDYYWHELDSVVDQAWDDVFVLRAVVLESATRVSKNRSSKSARVLEKAATRLSELIELPFPEEPRAVPGEGALESPETWPQVGLLSHMGYHVALKDPGTAKRRLILTRIFQGPIPRVNSPEYMRKWSSDGSWPRLYRLAWSIASFADNQLKKKSGGSLEAIATWAGDLEWLRATFYEGHFEFPWPALDLE